MSLPKPGAWLPHEMQPAEYTHHLTNEEIAEIKEALLLYKGMKADALVRVRPMANLEHQHWDWTDIWSVRTTSVCQRWDRCCIPWRRTCTRPAGSSCSTD